MRLTRNIGSTLAALLCLAVPASTQQPTFTVSVNVVDVDVTVKDGQGNFVTGLTADDFDVFEDGKPQAIQTFSYIELPSQRPDRFRFAGLPIPADVRTNRDVESGRVYIIVLDDLNVAPMRTAIVRRRARDFIEQHLGPRDLAAVVVTSGRSDAGQEFTSDPALLLRAIDHFFGQRLQPAEMQRLDDYYQNQLLAGLNETIANASDPQQSTTVVNPITRNQSFDPANLQRGQRAVGVLNTIASLAEFLEGVRGRRKALLWFSEGIDYPMGEAFSSQSGSEILRATRDAVSAAGREAFASRDVLGNGEAGTPKWQTFGYTGRIPLKDMPPGRYLLRLEAVDRGATTRQPAAAQTVITVR